MRTFIIAGAFLLTTLCANTAGAASFCMVGMAIPPQCMYDVVVTCNGASTPPDTYCDINPVATLKYYGSQRYCIVDANLQAQCMYNSRILCQSAVDAQSICIDRGETPDDVNPYRYDTRTQE